MKRRLPLRAAFLLVFALLAPLFTPLFSPSFGPLSALTLPASALESTLDRRFSTPNRLLPDTFSDLSEEDWFYSAMKLCYETGLMTGTDRGAQPTKALSQTEAAALAARVAATLRGESIPDQKAGEDWWAPYWSYLTDNRLVEEFSLTDGDATRQQFLDLLYLSVKELFTSVNTITALPDTADEKVLEFYNSGILTGKDAYGTFDGSASLSRAEAAAMLARLLDPAQRLEFTPQEKESSEHSESNSDASDYQSQLNSTAALFVNGEAISLQDYVATLNSLQDQFCSYYSIDPSTLYSGLYGAAEDYEEYFMSVAENSVLEDFYAEKLAEIYGCKVSELAVKMTPSATTQELKTFAAEYPYYRARHILILSEGRTDAEAKALAQALIDQITANPSTATFNALISAYNEDPGMSSNPYGYLFTEGEMVTEFENAVKALGEYEYTLNPVKTSYGYHVIMRLPAQSHPDILAAYQNAMLAETLESNINSSTITRNEKMLAQLDVSACYADYLSKNR